MPWEYTKCQKIKVSVSLGWIRTKNLFAQTILGKIFAKKLRTPVKLDWTRKLWFLLFHAFWLLLPKLNLCKRDWPRKLWFLLFHAFWLLLPKLNLCKRDWLLDYVSSQIWDFPKLFLLPNILTLKAFSNSWDNSYTEFLLLVTTFRFTCA